MEPRRILATLLDCGEADIDMLSGFDADVGQLIREYTNNTGILPAFNDLITEIFNIKKQRCFLKELKNGNESQKNIILNEISVEPNYLATSIVLKHYDKNEKWFSTHAEQLKELESYMNMSFDEWL